MQFLVDLNICAESPDGLSALRHDPREERLSQFVSGTLGEIPGGLSRIDRGYSVELPERCDSENEEGVVSAEQGLGSKVAGIARDRNFQL
jgi:hypothetical protein